MREDNWTEINTIWEEFDQSNNAQFEPLNIRHRAVRYLRKKIFGKMSRRDMRRLCAKINKMKNSVEKSEKARGAELKRRLQRIINTNNDRNIC
jgi:hypothetical protein